MNKLLRFLAIAVLLSPTVTTWSQCGPGEDNTPPTFEQTVEDISVCVGAIPFATPLNANDNCDGMLTITPVDDTTAVNDLCQGGTITRTWIATDNAGNEVSLVQVISVLPDDTAPVVNITLEDTSVRCENEAFTTWLTAQKGILLANTTDDCSIGNVFDDAPLFIENCADIVVTFTIEDLCGNSTDVQATYSIVDTIAPVLTNIPRDTTINCTPNLAVPNNIVATDNCSDAVNIEFSEVNTPQSDNLDCGTYQVIRTWRATDECGNIAEANQIIQVIDTIAPFFDLPPDLTLICGQDINDLTITGEITNLVDSCDVAPSFTYTDNTVQIAGGVAVQRQWIATDACGNERTKVQIITIEDTEAPTFTVPADIMVDCGGVADLSITGEPTDLQDNCDVELEVIYEDLFTTGNCASGGAIQRVWKVTDDAGNTTEQTQQIMLNDEIPPVFDVAAQDKTISCGDTLFAEVGFMDWVMSRGNALASDNCSSDNNLTWFAFNAGTNDDAALPEPACNNPDGGVVFTQAVDFIVQDECGNTATSTATFTVVDEIAPVFVFCPSDTTVLANDGDCGANFRLIPPRVKENCGALPGSYSFTITEEIVSDAPNDKDVPVNTVRLSFPVLPSNDFASDSAALTILLENVDGEQATEYFRIEAEDGTFLGRTTNVSSQCGNSQTIITNISGDQINQWAGTNDLVTFFLIPNIVEGQPERFSINDICVGAQVQATLFFQTLAPANMTYEYQINNEGRVNFLPSTPIFTSLTTGRSLITYYAIDCAGNSSQCTYEVMVMDQDPPIIACPSDTILSFDDENCVATYTLPLPSSIIDNCGSGNPNSIRQPATEAEAFLQFDFDPDLNDYLARDKSFTFTNLTPTVLSNVTLTIELQGDMDNTNAFFTIVGDDDIPITTTALGQANVTFGDCSQISTTTITLPPNTYNAWAADGEITITAFSNNAIPIPPGGPGDGVNPCDPSVVTTSGDTDGVSKMYATLSFDDIQFEYFGLGATEVPNGMIAANQPLPNIEFEVGTTEIFYIVRDGSSNTDTCSFTVTVEDKEAPIALCTGTTISINPSGIDVDTLQVADLDLGSSDNCTIDTMYLTPNIFDCSFATQNIVNVSLVVIDKSGNQDVCEAPVRVVTESPEPSYFIPPCGGDTLFLFANPPVSSGNNTYTYEWSGPNDFVSNQINPIIPNIDDDNAGSYQVTITGITGCQANGIIEVAINDLPFTPDIIIPEQLCSDQPLVLTSSVVPDGVSISYRWFEGTPSESSILGTTQTPSLNLGIISDPGIRTFYVQMEVDGCLSLPSLSKQIEIVETPTAVVNDPNPAPICEGESIQIGTSVTGSDLEYNWQGPDGFVSNAQIPPVIDEAKTKNDGIYRLVITRKGCESNTADVVVTVRPSPTTPMLSVTNAACEGEDLTLRMNVNDAEIYRWIEPDGTMRTTVDNILELSNVTQEQVAGIWSGFVTTQGCDSETSNPINVVVNSTPMLSVSANPNNVCEGDDLMLMASPIIDGATYEWTGPDEFEAVGSTVALNNVRANRTGNYFCTITTPEGCENIASTEVAVQENVRITGVSNSGTTECLTSPIDVNLAVTVFPPDDGNYTYLWAGPDFTSVESTATIVNATEANSGVYTVQVTNQNGCSSIVGSTTVSLRDAPSAPNTPRISEATSSPFCEGDPMTLVVDAYNGTSVSYNWTTPGRGNLTTSIPTLSFISTNINDTGEYAVTVLVDGCETSQSGTIPIEVNQIPSISVRSNSPICEGERLELETDFIEGAIYEWTGPSNFTSSGVNPVIPEADPDIHDGTYRVRIQLNGCTSESAEVTTNIDEKPQLPTAANMGPICIDEAGAELRLFVPLATSTAGALYTWYDQNLEQIGAPTDKLIFPITDFSTLNEGTNKFYVEANLKSCQSGLSRPTEVVINKIPSNAAFAGEDVAVCEAQSVTLDALSPTVGEGFWQQVAGDTTGVIIANPDDPETVVFGLAGEGTYTFQWSLSNGACEDYSRDQVDIVLNPNEAAFAGDQIDTCRINRVQLEAIQPSVGIGRWTQSDVQRELGVTIEDVFDPKTVISGLSAGNQYRFTWTVVGGTCSESSDVAIVIVSGGLAYAGIDRNDCGDGCVTLAATPSPTSVGRWSSTNPDLVFNDPTDPQSLVCGLELGKNTFIWETDNAACGASSIDTVLVNFQTQAIAVPDTVTVALGNAIDINVIENDNFIPNTFSTIIVGNPQRGQLEDLGGGLFRYQSNSTLSGSDAFVYELCPTGCDCSEAVVNILIGANNACEVPSIITPNDDGVNDSFVIPCLTGDTKFPNNEVLLYNQWGDEVFRSTNYQNDWRGTFNGEALPVGNYFYVIDFGDGSTPQTGYLVIQR